MSKMTKRLQPASKAVPKVKPVQADTLQSGRIDNAGGISQGLFSGQKTLKAYKKGGMVKKTGPAVVHKGERVLTTAQAKKMPTAKLAKVLSKKGK